MSNNSRGALLVGLAATLWATDALFRLPAAETLDPVLVVLAEHLIGILFMLPWLVLGPGKAALQLKPREWTLAALVGVGGSALATVLFTASFKYVNPSVSILLQKLQPVMVVLMAWAFLGERPRGSFFGWAALALGAGLLLSFPDLKLPSISSGELDLKSKGSIYSLSAAGIWAISTVIGKGLLRTVSPGLATFWRFAFASLALLAFQLTAPQSLGSATRAAWDSILPLTYIGLGPGLLAMLAYYSGLGRTTATITTFVELIFPVSAVLLNWAFLGSALNGVQLLAGTVLLAAVTRISLAR